jgi:hypothetical protein
MMALHGLPPAVVLMAAQKRGAAGDSDDEDWSSGKKGKAGAKGGAKGGKVSIQASHLQHTITSLSSPPCILQLAFHTAQWVTI